MQTYRLVCMLFACAVVTGCAKSENSEPKDPKEVGADANYTLLLDSGGMLTAKPLNATIETVTLNPDESPFAHIDFPELTFREGSVLGMYNILTSCSGIFTKYDFDTHTSEEFEVFGDLGSCDLSVTAIASHKDILFISYTKEVGLKDAQYYVRVMDISTTAPTFVDVDLDKKPVQMIVANNRLFILTLDEEITLENSMSVMDLDTNTLIHEMGLGHDARQIIKHIDGNVIISYDELHSLLNSQNFSVKHTNYATGLEPKFSNGHLSHMDSTGKLYYMRPTNNDTVHPTVPAIYDFLENIAYVYIYTNFLTSAQIEFEYEIGNTTMVSYDEANNLMLIGYQKTGDENKGGLLRVKPVPEPAFIDNIDFDGVPYDVYVE